MQNKKSFRQQLQSGAFWTVSMRWGMRVIGLISTAVLARLLAPEDYGLVAIAIVLVSGVQVFFDLGIELSLIRDYEATRDDFDSAWTMRLIQANLLSLAIALLAPVAVEFYQEPRLSSIFYITALSISFKSLENIGVVYFQKDLDFYSDFKFRVLSKLVGTTLTLAFAFYYKSYMALVLGVLIQNVFSTLSSYLFSRYRPSFTLCRWRKLWSFSKWILVKNFSNYISSQGEYLITSKLAPMSSIGHYRWARELSAMVSTELIQPIARVATPGFAKVEGDADRLLYVYRRSLNVIASVAAPLVLGVGAVAQELIPLFLGGGDKWMPVVPILEILCFAAFFSCLYRMSNTYFVVVGKVKYTAYIDVLRSIFVLVLVYPAYMAAGFEGVAFVSVVATFIVMLAYYILLCLLTKVTFSDIVKDVGRPAIGSLVMFYVVHTPSFLPSDSPFLLLILKVLCGALIYLIVCSLLWVAAGFPKSLESDVIEFFCSKWEGLRGKS